MSTHRTCRECPYCRPTWKRILFCEICNKTSKIFIAAIIFLSLIFIIIILLWLLLRYEKPRFTLQDITRYSINISTNPCFVTSMIQVTVTSFNPNEYTDIYFDSLWVYGMCYEQQITESTRLLTAFERRNEVNVWSAYLYGTVMLIDPDNALSMSHAKDNDVAVELVIRIHVSLRYRLRGGLKTHHHLTVDCPAYITLGRDNKVVKYQLMQSCSC